MTFEYIAWTLCAIFVPVMAFFCFLLLALAFLWAVYTIGRTIWNLIF